ncbi:MAG: helix-turn-helix transcriptional regulator [Oscillospiraceae bacterium]|jgi:DNA-binding PadR family transcriptional regulator|nr:helix-turn-helix transcriptional regulator [Oscillospiraceae bacterium]
MYDTLVTLKRGLTEILALNLLLEGDQYGYQFVRLIRSRSEGDISLTEGALYTTLYRLEAAGHVTSEDVLVGLKRRRRYYKITDQGKAYAKTEIEKYERLASGVMKVLKYKGE